MSPSRGFKRMKVIPSTRRKSFQERRYLNRVPRAPVIHTVGIHVYPNATQVIRQEVINDYVNLFKNNFSKNILQIYKKNTMILNILVKKAGASSTTIYSNHVNLQN